MEIRNVLPAYSQAELKNEDAWKHNAVEFKSTACTVFGVVFENIFMPTNPSPIKKEYQSDWIVTYLCSGTLCSLFGIMGSLLSCTPVKGRFTIHVNSAAAIDYEWQANFGKQESVCIKVIFINLVCTITLMEINIVKSPFLCCCNSFSHVLLAGWNIRTCLSLRHRNIFIYWYLDLCLR